MNGSERGWDSEVDASLCKELEGKTWDIDGSVFIFKKAEKRGARTIRACGWGTEAFAVHATEKVTGTPIYSRMDSSGSIAAFNRITTSEMLR